MKFYRYLVLPVLLFFLTAWVAGNYWQGQVYQAVDTGAAETQTFVIESGESARSVGQRLQKEGLIKSPLFFRLYLRLQNSKGTHIQAGEYELSPSMNLAEIVAATSASGSFETGVTFIEGWRTEQYTAYLSEKCQLLNVNCQMLSASEFSRLAKAHRGYLFPDTYFIDAKTTAEELVEKMRTNFDKKFDAQMREDLAIQNLSLEEAVILASIVEREVATNVDRPIVAGILIKRHQNGWPLEADATVQYSVADENCGLKITRLEIKNFVDCDWWPKELTEDDLEIDSPYNTRANVGLPPTPISNPGLAALQAVIYPQETDYWYYLTDEDGTTHYATTLDEHNTNILRYLQ